jgi:signal transduction histidine kinase
VWVDVAETVEAVLGIYDLKFRYKRLTIRREIQPELRIKIEVGELKQIMSNLLANACDACQDDCEILIRVHAASIGKHRIPGVRFTVADTGVGIPDDVKPKIFAPFFTTKEVVGTGLGLWITKSLIEKRKGSISVRSRTTDPSGTVMSFTLPVESKETTANRTEALALSA